MGAKQELRRGIKSRQLKSGKLFISFDGTAAGPELTALGPDRYAVSAITKLAAGQYQIVLKESYEQDLLLSGFSTVDGEGVKVVASDKNSITITTIDSAGLDNDAQVACMEIATFDFHIFH